MQRLVLTPVAAVVFALALAAPQAFALKRHVSYGRPGIAVMPQVLGIHEFNQQPQILFPERDVDRSPSAPRLRQRICVDYRIFEESMFPDFKWVLYDNSLSCGWTNPGGALTFPEWKDEVSAIVNGYHVRVVVTWETARRAIARAWWDYNTTSDYFCTTTAAQCNTGYTDGSHDAYIVFPL